VSTAKYMDTLPVSREWPALPSLPQGIWQTQQQNAKESV
jgi:hypothetical protein